MKRILRLKMDGPVLVIALRYHLDIRIPEKELGRKMFLHGLKRIELHSPYLAAGDLLPVRLELEETERFSPFAVNVRIYRKREIRLRAFFLRPFNNISRCYFGSRRTGFLKLERFILRFPDVFLNVSRYDLESPQDFEQMSSVTQHEFGHVLGFKDQYRFKNDAKRRAEVADEDLMYRTGRYQRFQPYHMERLRDLAKKERIPVFRV